MAIPPKINTITIADKYSKILFFLGFFISNVIHLTSPYQIKYFSHYLQLIITPHPFLELWLGGAGVYGRVVVPPEYEPPP